MGAEQEGWYTDPYGRHEARWLSDGVPTKLVRDGGVEAFDEPPDGPPTQAWTPIAPPPGSATATDTLRADDLEAQTMPTLDQLDRAETSAAITTVAHPWFIARSSVRAGAAEPGPDIQLTGARRALLVAGGVLSGLLLVAASAVWVAQVVVLLRSHPPTRGDVPFAVAFALAAPLATSLVWRADRRARVPTVRRIQRAEIIGGLFALLVLLLFVWLTLLAY